jgi:hypothetical protein
MQQGAAISLSFVATCGVPDCNEPRVSRGYCLKHSSHKQVYLGSPREEDRYLLFCQRCLRGVRCAVTTWNALQARVCSRRARHGTAARHA